MDTNDLTLALREATDDVTPRPNFAADVLRGSRRRRSRNRFTIGAAVVGTAAVAVVAATVLPKDLAAPPPADRNEQNSQVPPMLTFAGGELIDDETVTRAAVLGWQSGLAGQAGAAVDISPDDLVGEPHVFWAGTTPHGRTAIVTQARTGESTAPVSGVVIDNPNDDRPDELELVAVSDFTGPFLLPDNQTLLAVDFGDGSDLRASAGITVDENGRSTRSWLPFADGDGVAIATLPADTNPLNVRVRQGASEEDGQSPVAPSGNVQVQDRGLPWPAEALHVPEPRDLPRPAWEIFRDGLRDSGLLDPGSYEEGEPQWTVAADLSDGRTLILSQHQELDNPAFVFAVLIRPDGSAESVTRVLQIDPAAPEPVLARAPDDQGWVVAAWGEQISYRTSETGSWVLLGTSAALVPNDAVEIQVGEDVIPFH